MPKEKSMNELLHELQELQDRYFELKSTYEQEMHDRLQAELLLRQREECFKAMFENTGDGLIIMTLCGEILGYNNSYANMHGYTPEEMQGKTIKDFDSEEFYVTFGDRIKQLEVGRSIQFEAEHYHKKGHTFVLEVTASLVNIGDKQYVVGSHRDITERRMAQEALKESEKRYKRLHETMRDCFVQTDMAGNIVDLNKSYCEMLGYTEDELVKLTYQQITPSKWHQFEYEIIEQQVIPNGYSDIYQK
jgi:PAS domain S-box-containing protein